MKIKVFTFELSNTYDGAHIGAAASEIEKRVNDFCASVNVASITVTPLTGAAQ